MSDDVKIALFICLTLATILALPVGCTMREQQLIADAVKSGASPMAARCAIASNVSMWQCAAVQTESSRASTPAAR